MYDVTFHPIRPDEVKQYVFSAITDRTKIDDLTGQLAIGEEETEHLRKTYQQMLKSWSEINDRQTTEYFTWTVAIIASYLHPFWYGKNSALKKLPEFDSKFRRLLVNICDLDEKLCARITTKVRNITLNDSYGGGGYIRPENIAEFRRLLSEQQTEDADLWPELIFSLNYATKRGCGVLVASGVHDTINGSAAHQENLRTLLISLNPFPVYFSVPDESDWKKRAHSFADRDPADYFRFVRQNLTDGD